VNRARSSEPRVTRVRAAAYTVPTDAPESDGTLAWSSTTAVVVEADAAGHTGVGYSYTDAAAVGVVHRLLAPAVEGCSVFDVRGANGRMRRAVRNLGTHGIAMAALSAVDLALWDLEARVLDLPLTHLLGAVRDGAPVYGSGGFTSYDDQRLVEQLSGWAGDGVPFVKMKVGREPSHDLHRVRAARRAIGVGTELFVDANGAYSASDAVAWAARFADEGVSWLEEPVTSEDLAGLRRVRDRAPAGMQVAAGEYADSPWVFEQLAQGAVDVLQIDATRCGGITGFLDAATIAAAHGLPVSAHCAPAAHAAPACAAPNLVHVEWFWDHTRLEPMLFDGVPARRADRVYPHRDAFGNGLTLKAVDAGAYAA
jgi:L-alanine-DL-glutamate epimerase-like enolase superfamily enzyme